MGVPSYYRWLSQKYRSVVIDAVEMEWVMVDGVMKPPDATLPNPNGIEYDNLYLDMNGIIHPCSHPENKPQPTSYSDIIQNIFDYVDKIFCIIRPRKLIYFAIDGVAPRAKMNQQRSRRFRAVKEAREKALIEAANEQQDQTIQSDQDAPTWSFDSNCITPGTAFMEMVSEALKLFISDRQSNSESWKNVKVILSDSSVPGEGEHKIMDFIRRQRGQPQYDPNLKHVLYGLDADLIMLGLATHEPHFTLLRETVTFNRPNELAIQNESASEKQAQFQLLRIYILREYLEIDLFVQGLKFEWNIERAIDDYVFLCFFVGNDFLPHMPCLEIREGAIDLLMQLYKKLLPTFDGYLTESGSIDLNRAESLLVQIGALEDTILQRRLYREQRFSNNERSKKRRYSDPASSINESHRLDKHAGPWSGSKKIPSLPRGGVLTLGNNSGRGNINTPPTAQNTPAYSYGSREENKKFAQEMKYMTQQPTRPKTASSLDTAFFALESQLNRESLQNSINDAQSHQDKDDIGNNTTVTSANNENDIDDNAAINSANNENGDNMNENDIVIDQNNDNTNENNIIDNDVIIIGDDDDDDDGIYIVDEPKSLMDDEKVASVESEEGCSHAKMIKLSSDEDEDSCLLDSTQIDENSTLEAEQSTSIKVENATLDNSADSPLKSDEKDEITEKEKLKNWNYLESMNEDNWRDRYYRIKFGHSSSETSFLDALRHAYISGLVWVLKYYYQGCCSWSWYYPYHYAPFAKELVELSHLPPIEFVRGEPVKPYLQLMSVLPAASRNSLPKPYHEYMTSSESPIIDFYPEDFEIDLNGKRQAWQGVALLDFIDYPRLESTLAHVEKELTFDEQKRNSIGTSLLFVRCDHALAPSIQECMEKFASEINRHLSSDLQSWQAQLNLNRTRTCLFSLDAVAANCQLFGCISPYLDAVKVGSRIECLPNLEPITDNRTRSACFFPPEYEPGHVFAAKLLPSAIVVHVLTNREVDARRRNQSRFERFLDVLEHHDPHRSSEHDSSGGFQRSPVAFNSTFISNISDRLVGSSPPQSATNTPPVNEQQRSSYGFKQHFDNRRQLNNHDRSNSHRGRRGYNRHHNHRTTVPPHQFYRQQQTPRLQQGFPQNPPPYAINYQYGNAIPKYPNPPPMYHQNHLFPHMQQPLIIPPSYSYQHRNATYYQQQQQQHYQDHPPMMPPAPLLQQHPTQFKPYYHPPQREFDVPPPAYQKFHYRNN